MYPLIVMEVQLNVARSPPSWLIKNCYVMLKAIGLTFTISNPHHLPPSAGKIQVLPHFGVSPVIHHIKYKGRYQRRRLFKCLDIFYKDNVDKLFPFWLLKRQSYVVY